MSHISKTLTYGGIAAVSLFVIVASFWYKGESLKIKTKEELAALNISLPQNNAVAEHNDIYTIEGKYPVISREVLGGKEVNLYFARMYRKKIEAFKQQAKESYTSTSQELLKDGVRSTYYLSFTEVANTNRYISLLAEEESYFIGMAHPSHELTTFIFDKEKKTLVDTSTLFMSGVPYLQRLSNLSRAFFDDRNKQTKEENIRIDTTIENEGFLPTTENFSQMLPTPSGLVIYFKEYQIAPYSAGPQQALISYSKIEEDLDWEGVLGDYK